MTRRCANVFLKTFKNYLPSVVTRFTPLILSQETRKRKLWQSVVERTLEGIYKFILIGHSQGGLVSQSVTNSSEKDSGDDATRNLSAEQLEFGILGGML